MAPCQASAPWRAILPWTFGETMKANATRVRNWLNSTDALNEEDSVQQEHKKLLREAWKRRRRLRIDANDENEDDDETSNGSWTSIAAAVVREDNAWNRVVERLVRTVGWVVVWQSLTSLLFVNDFAIANKLASKLFSRESIEAVKTIKSILLDVHKEHGVVDVFGKYRPYDILTSVVALNRLQNAAILYERMNRDQHQFPELVPEVNEKDRALVRDLVHYAVYAHAAYGWTMNLAMRRQLHMGGNVRALLRMTGVDRDDIIRAQWESKTHRPAYFVVRDRMHKSIVLCIRGTWSAHDLLTNLCCTPQDFESALAVAKKLSSSLYYSAEDLYIRATNRRRCGHHGMLEAARSVQKDSEAAISKALKENSNYSLILVGHSLGGGVAALLGTLFERNYPDLRVYIYGAPCVAPTYAKLHRNIVSVVMEGDPFRCISLGHIADVSIALSCLCEDPALRSEIIVRTSSPVRSMDDDDLEWCFDTMETLRTNMTAEKLFPPGRILLLSGDTTPLLPPWGWLWRRRRSTNRRGVSLREVPPRYFRDLVVGPQMVDLSKHVPSIYELTLRSLIDDST